jgi:autotransporter-associated beta strand protein
MNRPLVLFIITLTAFATAPLSATTLTWDGDGGTDDIYGATGAENWAGGTAPVNYDDAIFPGGLASGASTMPTVNEDGAWFTSVTFAADAPAYTVNVNGLVHELYNPGGVTLTNNSSFTQTFEGNGGALLLTGVLEANTADIVINSDVRIGSGSSSGNNWTEVGGSHDVYFSGTWTSSIVSSGGMYDATRGRFYMTHYAGTVHMGDIGTAYRGTIHVNSDADGALRLEHDNALGYAGSTRTPAFQIWGGETHNGTMELVNDITVTRRTAWLNGRTGAVADDPHILNVSGDNTLNLTADWNTGLSSTYAGTSEGEPVNPGNINLQSDDGLFTIIGGPIYNTESGDPGSWNLVLAGDGDGDIQSQVSYYLDNPGFDLIKKGAGTWTLSNESNDYSGTTTIEGGLLLVNGIHTGGAVYTVESGGTLGGNGSIGSPVTVHGVYAPGNSIDQQDLTELTIAFDGTWEVEYDGTTDEIDLSDVGGLIDLVSGAKIKFVGLGGPLTGAAYVFATYGDLSGDPAIEVDAPAGYYVDYAFGGNSVALVAVPEPSTAFLAVLSLAAFVVSRRRRIVGQTAE